MSKQGLQHSESEVATQLSPSIYERIGKEKGFMKLSQLFYDRVFDDTEHWFLNIFSSSTKQEAVENQYRFFVQTFGGPDLYRQKKGKYTRLAGRHANYPIGTKSANRWVEHMVLAIEDHDALKDDEEARKHLVNYFRYTAHYIVAAMEYMRPDQLSGGTQIDAGRVW
mmetsp:Transcript_8083/g.12219  ORF Transcript_8083/g.12219 Transcript_8083/m.12219 type:complete len:167 (-) Transcript_8083:83-583(-)